MSRAEIVENFRVALDTLRARKIRSGLTVLGIVIGVTSVISIASIISGLNGYIRTRVESMGSRTFFVSRIPFGMGPGRMPERIRVRKYLTDADATFLRESCPSLAFATAFASRIDFTQMNDNVRYGNEHVERLILRGAEPDYSRAIPLFSVEYGRFLSPNDLDHSRAVAVIGSAISEALFPHTDPLGKVMRLNGRPYEVIGVFEHDPGMFGGLGVDQFVLIPLTNFRKNYPAIRERFIAVSVREDAEMNVARNEVIEAMRRRRRVTHNGDNDFEIADPDFLSNLWDQLTGAMVLLTGIISSIGLLVGGIGVMNIMLISVTERTQEIGIRKAIGARKSDIRVQFLLEAVTLSGLGGVLGVLFGGAIAFAVRTLAPSIPATLSVLWVSLGVGISVSVGLFFGYYPANRAANLDPIVCLRYE
ncbi:MAG: FtsX-like permease family protein [Bryobacterales bacterium]|nr:FtsX-like permease family protein [Bryobacterales bacterium]